MALGPGEISPNVLAHEFGHILGFAGEYLRGYRDLGEDGYEVLEVIPGADDLMAAPGEGKVSRSYFEVLLCKINHVFCPHL